MTPAGAPDPGASDEPQPSLDAATVARELESRGSTWLLLDVRDPGSYREAHVRGARSVPYTELDAALDALPGDATLLVYAYGPESRLATWTVRDLRSAGFDALEVEGGFLDLRDHGAPVVRGRDGDRGREGVAEA